MFEVVSHFCSRISSPFTSIFSLGHCLIGSGWIWISPGYLYDILTCYCSASIVFSSSLTVTTLFLVLLYTPTPHTYIDWIIVFHTTRTTYLATMYWCLANFPLLSKDCCKCCTLVSKICISRVIKSYITPITRNIQFLLKVGKNLLAVNFIGLWIDVAK